MRSWLKQRWAWWYFGAGFLYLVWVLLMLFADRQPLTTVNYIPTALTRFPILEVSAVGLMVGAWRFGRQRKDWRDGMVLVAVAVVFVLLMLILTGNSLVTRGMFHISQNWTATHRYNLAADFDNYYYLYECDPAGVQCRLVYSLDLARCTDVDLAIGTSTQALFIRGYCDGMSEQVIIDSYMPTS